MSTSLDVREGFAGKPLRVMIADDQEIFRHGLRNILIDIDDFDVVAEASNWSEVLKKIAKMPADLVLMGVSLPGVDVIKAIQHLRNLKSPPQVVLLSTVIEYDTLLEAISLGASGYLTKALPTKDVVNALQGLQRGELALLPSVAASIIRLFIEKCTNLEKALAMHRQATKSTASSPPKISAKNTSHSTFFSPSSLHALTSREYKVFQLLCQGLSNKEIAAKFSISPYTVGKHVRQILRKLGAVNRTQAVSYASFEGENFIDDLIFSSFLPQTRN